MDPNQIPEYVDPEVKRTYTQFELDNEVIPRINSIHEKSYSSIKLKLYEQKDLEIGMTYFNNVWSLCTKNVLMIDFDYKLGLTRDICFGMLRRYTDFMHSRGIDLLFENYDTDRGLHSFLVNIMMDHTSEDSMRVMMDLHNDSDYIAYVKIRGFCVRIGPKFIPGSRIEDEFIAKPVDGEMFTIGYGNPLYYISQVLAFHLTIIKWFREQYITRFNELRSKRYIEANDTYNFAPPDSFIQEARDVVIGYLTEFGIKDDETTYEINYTPTRRQFKDHNYNVYMQEDIQLYYDLYYGIWSVCTPHILMIDFDEKDESTSKSIIEKIRTFADVEKEFHGIEYLFSIYETDKGIHAYVINKYISHTSDESSRLIRYIGNDSEHANFVARYGHCMRVSPKIYRNNKLQSREEIILEIVSRPTNIIIGHGIALDSIKRLLILQERVTKYLKDLYATNFDDMVVKKYSPQVNEVVYSPKLEFIQNVRDTFIKTLTALNIARSDTTFASRMKKVNADRYTDIVQDKMVKSCSGETMESIRAGGEIVVRDINPRKCPNKINGVKGPEVPFDFYMEAGANLLILVTYDVAMLDFDSKDGVEKDMVSKVIERLILSQRILPENQRITKSEMCFKMYETDNGVHAWPISHSFPYYTDQAIKLQLESCGDSMYAKFSSRNGYSIRMSPKVFSDSYKRIPSTSEQIAAQFVQKLGVLEHNTSKRTVYIGNKDNIDPYIEEMVDIIYDTQQYVLSIPDISKKMLELDYDVLYNVSDYVRTRYLGMKNKRNDSYARMWAMNTLGCG